METGKTPKTNLIIDAIVHYNAKFIFFIFLGLMFLSVIVMSEWPLITVHNAAHNRLYSMRWLLFPHATLGFIAMVTGPIQFSLRIRKRNLRLHRALGKIYVLSVLATSILAIIICLKYRAPGGTFQFTFENIIQASVWFITTLMAFLCARNRQVILHKIWMSRSYGVTFVFVTSRVLNPLPFIARMDVNTFGVYLWFCVVIALVIPEILLNWREIFITKKKTGMQNA